MPVILSLTEAFGAVLGAGPEGLFLYENGALATLPQPMEALYCCAVSGDRLLTGGSVYGAASRLIVDSNVAAEVNREWQGGWMDHTTAPVLTMACAPATPGGESHTLLAATAGDGILRSTNRGAGWSVCNFGLQEYVVLSLAWAPLPTGNKWLDRVIAFAGSEAAIYRSPAAGLAWKRVEHGPNDAVQAIATSPDFQMDGVVIAGTENAGIWRSCDGGREFQPVNGSPQRVDALFAGDGYFLAGTPDGVWRSNTGESWQLLPDSPAALCFLGSGAHVYTGSESGIAQLW